MGAPRFHRRRTTPQQLLTGVTVWWRKVYQSHMLLTLSRLTDTRATAREKLKRTPKLNPKPTPRPRRIRITATGTVTDAATTVTAVLPTPRSTPPPSTLLSLYTLHIHPRRLHHLSASLCL